MTNNFTMLWRCKGLVDGANSIEEMVAALKAAAEELLQMKEAGVVLAQPVDGDYAFLATNNQEVADQFGFEEEEEDVEEESLDLGHYDQEVVAALAHDLAARVLGDDPSGFNFSDEMLHDLVPLYGKDVVEGLNPGLADELRDAIAELVKQYAG